LCDTQCLSRWACTPSLRECVLYRPSYVVYPYQTDSIAIVEKEAKDARTTREI
jgi:hypothetical protein